MNREELIEVIGARELEIARLRKINNNLNNKIDKTTKALFSLKDMIYNPDTREENIYIQREISSIIKEILKG